MPDRSTLANGLKILRKKDENGKFLIQNVDGVRQLLGGCRRTLESYPDHPGLLFLSSLARMLLPIPDLKLANEEFVRSLQGLTTLSADLQEIVIQVVMGEFNEWLKDTRDYDSLIQIIVKSIISTFPTRQNARLFIELMPAICEKILVNLLLQDIQIIKTRLLQIPS